MADTTAVVEGRIKFRDGKKWKTRWCAMKKPSPVADRLQVLLYKDVKEAMREGGKPKRTCLLEGFYGLESGFSFDREANVMAVICQKQVFLMAFESREDMIQFEVKIRRSLGEEHQFRVRIAKVPPNSKLPLQLVQLHIHGPRFCLTAHIPPRILQTWQISDLRRFGSVEGKFCFEGGSKCGKGVGFHVLTSDHADDIAKIVHLASVGKSPSCQRAANKRSSHFPGTLDSIGTALGSSQHHGNSQSVLGGFSLGRNTDLWSWNKRHSISVIDYRRMAGLTDKLKMMSMEKFERQRMMAIYDIPPKRVRKVDSSSTSSSSTCSKQKTDDKAQRCPLCCAQRTEKQNVCIHGHVLYPGHFHSSLGSAHGDSHSLDGRDKGNMSENYSNYLPVGQQGTLQLSVIEDEFRSAVDRCKRQEALQSLKNEESSLQREITLLDEILQVCKNDDHVKKAPENQKGHVETNPNVKASSLPAKVRKDYAVDAEFCKHVGVSVSAENCSRKSSATSKNPDSPGVLSKLEKIRVPSKLLVPLPYINLSKFDENGGESSSHVHMPGSRENLLSGSKEKLTNGNREKLTVANSLNNISSSVSGDKMVKSSSPSKIKEKLGMRSSSESHIAVKSTASIREPIYANEVRRKSDTPPPELPPKGPALLRKSINRGLMSMMSGTDQSLPPPLPPARDRSKSVGSTGKIHGYDNAPGMYSNPITSAAYTSPQDCYLMMGEFMDEPKPHRQVSAYGQRTSNRLNRSFDEPSYFDMVGESGSDRESLRYSMSYSSSSSVTMDNQYGSSSLDEASPAPALPPKKNEMKMEYRQTRPESNYMEMTGITGQKSSVLQNLQTLQNYVSTTPAGDGVPSNSVDTSGEQTQKPAIPFPQLITYQKPKVESNPPVPATTKASVPVSQEQPKESGGFLARFKRRNSRDQKAASQSQENLICGPQRSSILERSLSEQGETPKAEKVQSSPLLKIGRRRSSSFPNRLSYQESITESKTSSESSREDIQLYISEKQLRDSDRANGFQYRQPSADSSRHSEDSERSTSDSFFGDDYKDSDIQPLLKNDESKKEIKVLTVLHVCQDFVYNPTSDSKLSKTDDEKMIELLQNGYSANLTKMSDGFLEGKSDISFQKSPAQQASEIARHAMSLPPFIPPKLKNYSTLSPVKEISPPFPKSVDNESIYVEMKEPKPKESPQTDSCDAAVSSPSAQKQEAKATLRISAAVEDDNGKIWVPQPCSPVPATTEASGSDDVDNPSDVSSTLPLQCSTLVVSVDDVNELDDEADRISVSSYDSDTHSIRSSPASTILRPRSGKDYQIIDRRHTVSESETSSPRTPYSPSTATVFSFDSSETSCSSSTTSTRHNASVVVLPSAQQIREMELNRAKSYSRETSPEASLLLPANHGYLNIGVNLHQQDGGDVERPHSVSRETSPSVPSQVPTSLNLPAEQVNPQLNYCEIDLSQPANPTKKHKKPVPKKVTAIEYAQIDMIATRGLSKASLQHAQSRKDTDSLRRSVSCVTPSTRKNSFSTASSQRERKCSARERKVSTGSLDES